MEDREYYEEQRKKSEAYQLYIKDVWLMAFSLMTMQRSKYTSIGNTIDFYDTKEEQYNIGESAQGVEVKYDIASFRTNNLYIEIEEATKIGGKLVSSGIYRKDNTTVWVTGTYHYAYIIPKSLLVAYHKKKQPNEIVSQRGTSKGFLIPRSDIDKWISTGHIERIDITLKNTNAKENSYYVDYMKNNYYITDISLNNLNKNNT